MHCYLVLLFCLSISLVPGSGPLVPRVSSHLRFSLQTSTLLHPGTHRPCLSSPPAVLGFGGITHWTRKERGTRAGVEVRKTTNRRAMEVRRGEKRVRVRTYSGWFMRFSFFKLSVLCKTVVIFPQAPNAL